MAEKSLFFNALPDPSSETGYDRNYNADDISDWISIVCDTGVLKGGLQVSAGTGLSVNVAIGKATIKGKGYINNSVATLSLPTPSTSSTTYGCVVLRMDNTQTVNGRKIYLMITPSTTTPSVTNLTRTESIYDLMLGYAVIPANASSITQVVDKRGDQTLCPYFTAVKGYDDYYDAIVQQYNFNGTMATTGTTIVTNLASNLWNDNYSIIDVYCNGLKEESSDFTAETSNGYISINFTAQKLAGAEISVVLSNFIDGEGLSTAIDDYNQWVADVAALKEANEYNYLCDGLIDNQNITNIVNEFINGGTDYSSMKLNIIGTFGCNNGTNYPTTTGGSGTSANPYRIFNFASGNRKVILDFTNCTQLTINVSGVYATIFYCASKNFTFKGINLVSNSTSSGTQINVFNQGVVCEDSRFWINGYSGSNIAPSGTFTNCRASVSNASGNSYCFLNTDLLRLNGGEYLAYTGASASRSAVVGQSAGSAVSILYGINAPTISRSGYYQTNSLYQVNTTNYINCTDMITTLPTYVTSSSTIRDTIALNKN